MGKYNNNFDDLSNEMTNMINSHKTVKGFLFNNEFHPGMRGTISPLNQQPEKISEKLLCQRLDEFIKHSKKLKKTKPRKKYVKYSK